VTLRLGFFGAGLIANFHAASLRAGGADATIVAVTDPDAGRAAAFVAANGGRACGTEEEVFDAADAVYVCTWTSEHARLVAEAAARRLATFCEKPLAVDLAAATAMTEAVTTAGVTHQVGLVLRSVPGFVLLHDLLHAEGNGRVMTAVFRDDQEIPLGGWYGSTWRGDVARAGAGTLLEHSIHDLDLLEWRCGPVASLSAQSANLHGHAGIEDSVATSFRFARGGTGVLTSTWHDIPGRPSCRRFEVFTERGWFEAEGNAAEAVHWERRAGDRHSRDSAAAQAQELGARAPVNADVAFVEAAKARRPAHPDFSVALRAHVLADAVYRSAAAGGVPIELPAT
jgi:predicted dehydrogenase